MKNQSYKKRDSLCWDCQRATGFCPWSKYKKFEPVPGWTVEKTIRIDKTPPYTYEREGITVLDCPLFVPDGVRPCTNY